ncbi:efflux RND transporter periplasmic adaptor subunit [Thermomonas hydrothermalis]|uniref:Membrane fusion protein, multidrug efflux system n=1 Tax=Thermomonas hydrothermalis TaxID=213588 RepID=A0A1M4S839_9GAMM|nr:efflux RND transporter periplasmic adaptor subunit [Thermomonas hydrothermalis]SHE28207.1 membrane fusion protein, multidrug efflux system [Thermomonas hydrothermalis]
MPSVRALRLSLICLAMLTVTGCGRQAASGPAGRGSGGPQAVVVQTVALRDWQDRVQALGTVRAREAVTLTAKVTETVEQVHFESGQEVAKGAPLITLSGAQQQAALAQALAQERDAEAQYQRLAKLAQQQLVAAAVAETARATRDAVRAQVAQIRANLADRVIRAPFSGVLGIRQVSPGALVTPGTVIATLDDLSRVYVDFPVPETELAGLAPGQHLTGQVSAWPQQRFEGRVMAVTARLDPATRAATVRGEFPNPQRQLQPGMLMQVTLVRAVRPAVVVPELAVQQVGNETFVWRVKPDATVEKVAVVVGGRIPGWVMLRDGLRAGERIVVEGTGKLRPGARVRAVQPAAAMKT